MEALQGRSFSRFAAIMIAVAVLTALVIANLSGSGQVVTATHQPADKAVASGDYIVEVPMASGEVSGPGTDVNNIMTAKLKTSTPTDLILAVTLECSLITNVFVPVAGEKGASSTGNTEGRIRVWIVVDDLYIVPIKDLTGTTQGHAEGSDIDKVTFCNREHKITITDTEDPTDKTDQHENYLRTKDANAFNWVALNLGNGVHHIDVRADFVQGTSNTGSYSTGLVGNRSLVVTPSKLANDATI